MSGTSALAGFAALLREVSGALLMACRLMVLPGVHARLGARETPSSLSEPLLVSEPDDEESLDPESLDAGRRDVPGRDERPRVDVPGLEAERDPSTFRAMMLELTVAAASNSPWRSITVGAGCSTARRDVDRRTLRTLRVLRVLRALRVLDGRTISLPASSKVSTEPKSSSSRHFGLVDGLPVE